jgi:tetratricopeptide (TPR) repeat protein
MYEPVRTNILANVPAGTTIDRLKAIHAATHRFILTGAYEETCSDLRKTFANGDFNCLTALAVCLDLCQSAGLKVQPRLIRGHVLLAIETASGDIRAFEPGTVEWFVRPMIDVEGSRKLSHVELLGKFYYNRGVEMLRAGSYQDGLALLRTGVALDPSDDDARANLVAGLNNWAVEQCQDGRYREAALLIEQGLALDPGFAPLIANEQLMRAKLAK